MTTSSVNPGSPEAIAAGCRCPVIDNCHGRGARCDGSEFFINGDCPVHAPMSASITIPASSDSGQAKAVVFSWLTKTGLIPLSGSRLVGRRQSKLHAVLEEIEARACAIDPALGTIRDPRGRVRIDIAGCLDQSSWRVQYLPDAWWLSGR